MAILLTSIVYFSRVLANEENIGYEEISNEQASPDASKFESSHSAVY